MRTYLLFMSLLICISCASKRSQTNPKHGDMNEIRIKVSECISSSEGVSAILKNHVDKIKKADGSLPFHFSQVKTEGKDKEIIRVCKRKVLQERRNNRNK